MLMIVYNTNKFKHKKTLEYCKMYTLEEWKRKWKMKLNIDKVMVLTVILKSNPT